MGKYKDNIEQYIGKKYNTLTVIGAAESRVNHKGANIDRFICKCDCGKEVIKDAGKVVVGRFSGCGKGCKYSYNITHGLSHTRLYHEYMQIIARCYNPDNIEYHNYGGRGIGMALIWRNPDRIPPGKTIDEEGLREFIRWSYEEGGYYDQPKDTPRRELLSIERKDVNKGYSPDNCTWISLSEQTNNKRNTAYIWDGEEWLSYGQFYKKYDLREPWINTRLKAGWSFSALVYAAKNQELGIRMDKHTVQPKLTTYVTKDGFSVLIPIIHPPEDNYHKQENRMKYAGVVMKQTPDQVKKYRKNRKEKLLKEGKIKEALKVNLDYPSNGTGTWTWDPKKKKK